MRRIKDVQRIRNLRHTLNRIGWSAMLIGILSSFVGAAMADGVSNFPAWLLISVGGCLLAVVGTLVMLNT